MTDLLYLMGILLLPIVPAFLLFKALPSTGDVSGPLGGLQIKLSGAFAGYFAIVVLLFVMYHVWHPTYGVYKIHGTVTDENGNPIPGLDGNNLTLEPAGLTFYPDGSFDMKVVAANGDWPKLSVNYPNYMSHPVLLDPGAQGMKKDSSGVILLSPISLTKLPSYTGGSVAAVPVAVTPEPKP